MWSEFGIRRVISMSGKRRNIDVNRHKAHVNRFTSHHLFVARSFQMSHIDNEIMARVDAIKCNIDRIRQMT